MEFNKKKAHFSHKGHSGFNKKRYIVPVKGHSKDIYQPKFQSFMCIQFTHWQIKVILGMCRDNVNISHNIEQN